MSQNHQHDHNCGCACLSSFVKYLSYSDETECSDEFKTYTKAPVSEPQGDDVYYKAKKIYTMDEGNSEAVAVRISGENIAAVYTQDEWDQLMNSPEWGSIKDKVNPGDDNNIIENSVLFPGFYECHLHPLLDGLLASDGNVDLRNPPANTTDKVVDALQGALNNQVASNSEASHYFVVGYNEDPYMQDIPLLSNWQQLLKTVQIQGESNNQDVYVLVEHTSMHIWYANSTLFEAVLKNAGENAKNPEYFPMIDPNSGDYSLDNYYGIIQEDTGIEALMTTISGLVSVGLNTLHDAIGRITRRAHQVGCTSIAEAMLGSVAYDAQAYSTYPTGNNELFPVRMVVHPFYAKYSASDLGPNPDEPRYLDKNCRIKVGAVKMVIDGSLQGGTAAGAPYRDETIKGVYNITPDQLRTEVIPYIDNNYQLMMHANGTGAIQAAIDAVQSYEEECQNNPNGNCNKASKALRHRIEHCQTVTDAQLNEIKELDMVPNFLVNHVLYWGKIYEGTPENNYEDGLLEYGASQSISPFATSEACELTTCLHSDAFVTPLNPLQLVWTAVTRRTKDLHTDLLVDKPLGAEYSATVQQAMKSITYNAAYINHEEDIKGSIEQGKLADFTLLDSDPFEMDPMDIIKIKVNGTVLGGDWLKVDVSKEPGLPYTPE